MYRKNQAIVMLLLLLAFFVGCTSTPTTVMTSEQVDTVEVTSDESAQAAESDIERPELSGDALFQNLRVGEEARLAPATDSTAPQVVFENSDQPVVGYISVSVNHPSLVLSHESFKETMRSRGFVDGQNMTLVVKDAQGDIAALERMAQELIDDQVDLIVSNSTTASVAVHKALSAMETPIPLIFSSVTNPYVVGIAQGADAHAPWLTGSQIYPPLLSTLELMRGISGDATTIGTIYNASEPNSIAQLEELKTLAPSYNFSIVESTTTSADNTEEAALALVDQGVDFIYVFQDATVSAGTKGIVEAIGDANIPLISNMEGMVSAGAAIGLASSFAEDGRIAADMAARFLRGDSTLADMDIRRVGVSNVSFNRDAAAAQGVRLTPELTSGAFDLTPVEEIEVAPETNEGEEEATAEDDGVKVGMIVIAEAPPLEVIRDAFKAELAQRGFAEGTTLTILDRIANGDPSLVAGFIEEFAAEDVDLIIATTTPILAATYEAMQAYETPIPVVFNAVTSPYAIGVAESADNHPNWLVGSQLFPPLLATVETISALMPDAEQIGMVYDVNAANAVAQADEMALIAQTADLSVQAVGVNEPSEILGAAQSLIDSGVDVLFFSQDLTIAAATVELAALAGEAGVPLFTNTSTEVARGAAVGLSTSLVEDGRLSAEIAADILNGADVADIPIQRVSVYEIGFNRTAAEAQGLGLPTSVTDRAIDQTP